MNSQQVEFLAAFEALGYQRTRKYEVFGKGDRWYVFNGNTPTVTHVAYLIYKPSLHAYAPQFGVFSAASQERAVAALPWIYPYLHPTFSNGMWSLEHRPCWTLFDAARQLGWERMCVPDPGSPNNWQIRLDEMVRDLLEPIFWRIEKPVEVMDLLLRKDKTFEWAVSYSVLRLTEIIALAKDLSCSESVLKDQLVAYEPSVVRDMYGSKDYTELLDKLIRVI